MKFKVKDMDIETGDILVAILNEHDAKVLDLAPEDRIKIRRNRYEVTAALDISESRRAVPRGSIGLFEEVLDKLHAKQGDVVRIGLTKKPESVRFIREKLYGKKLDYAKFYSIVDDIAHDRLTAVEKTYFVAGSHTKGLDIDEIVDLTKALVNTGEKLTFRAPAFDKHCIGGIPGNRTTMVVVPIVAAAGLLMPKTSSRAITSPAGTADTMEVLAKVTMTVSQLQRVVKKTNACIAWGGAMNLAPADDKIIEVEYPISLDTEGQMLASVMAKKASVGAKKVLIDIPFGRGAKCETSAHALHLSHMFKTIGRKLGMHVQTMKSDGRKPIGKGIGPVLEAQDVLSVLRNEEGAPRDLREKSLRMAGRILEMGGIRQGYNEAVSILESLDGLRKMQQIVRAQGAQEKKYDVGEFSFDFKSKNNGVVRAVDNKIISKIARMAGAPHDKGAGLFIERNVGDKVQRGEKLFTIYAGSVFKLSLARDVLKQDHVYKVG
jgi:putative thymidine phosphorylase